jgi:hypothetical protein
VFDFDRNDVVDYIHDILQRTRTATTATSPGTEYVRAVLSNPYVVSRMLRRVP